MVLGYHVIITTYGFWLPNDPRGSWSDFVRSWELSRFGPATKVTTRRSVAAAPHDRSLRAAAKSALQYPEIQLTGIQAREVGCAIGDYANKTGLVVWACSVLPEHIHLVLRRYRFKIEQAVNLLKGAATARLDEQALHPLRRYRRSDGRLPPMWTRREWKVYLDDPADIRRAIRYVEENPAKEGKRQQFWSFVSPYEEETRSPSAPR
jgi:REP element-mobilizing transposase RayT